MVFVSLGDILYEMLLGSEEVYHALLMQNIDLHQSWIFKDTW